MQKNLYCKTIDKAPWATFPTEFFDFSETCFLFRSLIPLSVLALLQAGPS